MTHTVIKMGNISTSWMELISDLSVSFPALYHSTFFFILSPLRLLPCSYDFFAPNSASTSRAVASLCLALICVIMGRQIKDLTVLLRGQLHLNTSVSVTCLAVQIGFSLVFTWRLNSFNPILLTSLNWYHYITYRSTVYEGVL